MAKKNKTNEDEEFEKLIREFIDNDLDNDDLPEESLDNDSLDDQSSDEDLPFPKEMNSRVANAMTRSDDIDHSFLNDVASVRVEVAADYDKNVFWNAPVEVTFHRKPKTYLSQHRFRCFIYTDTYYPVCSSVEDSEVKRKGKTLTVEIPSSVVWIPGNYILLINDVCDASIFRVSFSLSEDMTTTYGEPQECPHGGLEDVLICCMEGSDKFWPRIAEMPGMAQFRRKAMEARQLLLYNELRKEKDLEEMDTCDNLLICTRNDDINKDILHFFQRIIILDCNAAFIDCSSFYNVACNNPFEPMNEMLNDPDLKMLCLTNLKELTGNNGKIIMRRIIEKIRDSRGNLSIWLCGTRQQIDELLNLYPSLKQFFFAESYVEQEPYTVFELVQTFFRDLAKENMQPNVLVKNLLTRAILKGYKQGVLTNWSLADVHRFVIGEIRPHYLSRTVADMFEDTRMLLVEEDIPFEKLTSGSSAFDESISELNDMIGLESVKQGIMTMANLARLFIERRRKGLNTSSNMIFHTIFTGNPGTGKTTVARKLGKIYRALGLLSKGEVIAVDRTRLVGRYIGDTEENMKNVIDEAKGNVLFIDEAYTLYDGANDRKDFGARVIDSLLTTLSQPNPDMLVIFAGYQKEMEAMLNTNPGLAGRFPYRYHFEDYSAKQLMEIALHLLERDEYILTDEAAKAMQDAIDHVLNMKSPHFGNARWIEQLVSNGIIPAMADRISSSGSTDYQLIEVSDVSKAFEKFAPQATEQKSSRYRVKGFCA